jgi:hypothetical protein
LIKEIIEQDQDKIIQLHKINKNLTFEFGPKNKRDFVISTVELIFKAKPE